MFSVEESFFFVDIVNIFFFGIFGGEVLVWGCEGWVVSDLGRGVNFGFYFD